MIISTRISTRILFWVLALACLGTVRPVSAAKVEDRIVAIVNSDLITWSELKREVAPERERLEKHYRGEELARRVEKGEGKAPEARIEGRFALQEGKTRRNQGGGQAGDQAVNPAR